MSINAGRTFVLEKQSSRTPLGAGGEFNEGWQNVEQWPQVTIGARSDVAGTMHAEFSNDGENVHSSLSYDVAANIPEFHMLTVVWRFFRVRYVNNGDPQSEFNLVCKAGVFQALSSPLNANIGRDADAQLVRSQPEFLEIATGKFSGLSKSNKSGRNSEISTGSVPEDITEQGGVYTGFPDAPYETLQVVSDNVNDAAGGTGAESVTIFGLDTDGNPLTQTIALNGTTPVNGTLLTRRAHSCFVSASNNGANDSFNQGTITVRYSTTTAVIFLTILPGRNQSNFSVYTVPVNKRGIITRVQVELNRAAGTNISGALTVRRPGSPPRLQRPFAASGGASFLERPYGGFVIPALTDIKMTVLTCSQNNTPVTGQFDIVLVDDD